MQSWSCQYRLSTISWYVSSCKSKELKTFCKPVVVLQCAINKPPPPLWKPVNYTREMVSYVGKHELPKAENWCWFLFFYSLRLFQKFDQFRILVCGGDGSVGWVLSEIDKLDLHKQVQTIQNYICSLMLHNLVLTSTVTVTVFPCLFSNDVKPRPLCCFLAVSDGGAALWDREWPGPGPGLGLHLWCWHTAPCDTRKIRTFSN